MKLRIEVWDHNYLLKNALKRHYEKYYKNNGWLLDINAEAIYYDIEVDSMPTEGQRLGTKFGISIVEWAYWDLDYTEDKYFKDSNYYFNVSRIVVRNE